MPPAAPPKSTLSIISSESKRLDGNHFVVVMQSTHPNADIACEEVIGMDAKRAAVAYGREKGFLGNLDGHCFAEAYAVDLQGEDLIKENADGTVSVIADGRKPAAWRARIRLVETGSLN